MRSRKNKGYRQHISERFGFSPVHVKQSIWIHCVSMGETIAMAPLIKSLINDYPDKDFVITTMTPTGRAQIDKIYQDITNVHYCYIPYDIGCFLAVFLKRINPIICIIMETEIWPNLLYKCHQQNISAILTNARLSKKSANGYAKIGYIAKHMLKQINHINAQNHDDYMRFIKLGMDKSKITVCGNLKYDFNIDVEILKKAKQLKATIGQRLTWVAASTHPKEDEIVLAAHKTLLTSFPNALLILVPRHPERFDQVFKLIQSKRFTVERRRLKQAPQSTTQVYLSDTMGEMMLIYQNADIAFVGGSFSGTGGHNMLEPAALQKPILSGPSVFNFMQVAHGLEVAQGLKIVNDQSQLIHQLTTLFNNPEYCQKMGQNAFNYFMQNKGALHKQQLIIENFLNASAHTTDKKTF